VNHGTPTVVRAVHRIVLATDSYGQITARNLIDANPLPPNSTVVLECGEGWWIRPEHLEHIRSAVSGVGHISVTGVFQQRKGGVGQFGIVYGIDAITDKLRTMLAAPPLFNAA
jgi:hypothetical protein